MISILMPIYNGVKYIDDSVASVISQKYKKWELLIGINGHYEQSGVYKMAKLYETDKVKILDLHTVKGKANALNEMIQFAKYDHIAILDVDDIWREDKLEIQVPFLKKYDVVGSQCIYFQEKEGQPSIPTGDITSFDFKQLNPIINSSVVVKKKLCNWDNKHNGVEDYDLWLRLKNEGSRFYNCLETLVKHRIHNESAFNAKGNNKLVNNIIEQNK
jgi:glycosyltransferase involved in cell wall biosynthesis